jgi:high-affinity nickel-transport protein
LKKRSKKLLRVWPEPTRADRSQNSQKFFASFFQKRSAFFLSPVICVLAGLAAANIAAWIWALTAFAGSPLLLGSALIAYGFGLRHAVDADHIAAIDNVTRKLMQDGKRPLGVGLFFSLGHSTIVIAASAFVALAAARSRPWLEMLHGAGGLIGTLVSAGFLFAIAVVNLLVLLSLRRAWRSLRAGETREADLLNAVQPSCGAIARLVRPLFGLIGESWQMYPLGVLFGLGFDTATEIGVLGLSATEASHHLPLVSVMIFPALFTAGMALVDTADGILMLGAYGWAFVQPVRKLYYNMAITLASVVVALLVGGIEVVGLIGDRLALRGRVFALDERLSGHFGTIGFIIAAVFALAWLASMIVSRRRLEADA